MNELYLKSIYSKGNEEYKEKIKFTAMLLYCADFPYNSKGLLKG
jgi:hypothetical protein